MSGSKRVRKTLPYLTLFHGEAGLLRRTYLLVLMTTLELSLSMKAMKSTWTCNLGWLNSQSSCQPMPSSLEILVQAPSTSIEPLSSEMSCTRSCLTPIWTSTATMLVSNSSLNSQLKATTQNLLNGGLTINVVKVLLTVWGNQLNVVILILRISMLTMPDAVRTTSVMLTLIVLAEAVNSILPSMMTITPSLSTNILSMWVSSTSSLSCLAYSKILITSSQV